MYEKIFPSRIAEVKEYLSQRSLSIDPANKKYPQTADQNQTSHAELLDLGDHIPS